MSAKKENATILGVGVAACAACCAGPILGVLAAIGLGTAAGFLLVGTVALVVGAAVIALVVLRRRRRTVDCTPMAVEPAPRRVLRHAKSNGGRQLSHNLHCARLGDPERVKWPPTGVKCVASNRTIRAIPAPLPVPRTCWRSPVDRIASCGAADAFARGSRTGGTADGVVMHCSGMTQHRRKAIVRSPLVRSARSASPPRAWG